MITSIRFINFKALTNLTVHLKDLNILTGPNNNGKSTILDGIRLLYGAYRYASRIKPKFLKNPFGLDSWGFEIPENSFPLSTVNLQSNFNFDEPSIIKYTLTGKKSLTLIFHPEYPSYLFFDTLNPIPKNPQDFRSEFPLKISIIPTLGPIETEEKLLTEDYVKRWYGSRLSPRMFRSYWYYNPNKFDEFQMLVEQTWPTITVSPPEKKDLFNKDLIMFCEEERMPREISWAGFGFQIWLQLLTHIVHAKDVDLLVVDEPEIYLHPDLQHKLLKLISIYAKNIIIATHSIEIINYVDPGDVILVDKKTNTAKRITDIAGLQNVSNILGSGQNIELTRLAKGKKVLFVEGKDLKLLSKLAKICSYESVFSDNKITVIPIDGFSQHDKIIHTNWAFTKVLGEELLISVILDRDYRVEEEVDSILEKLNNEIFYAHILKRKELENYFLIIKAVDKAVINRLDERVRNGLMSDYSNYNINQIFFELTDSYKSDIIGQFIAHKLPFDKKLGIDISTTVSQLNNEFEKNWLSLDYRLKVIPGKQFFTSFNLYIQEKFKISITLNQVANNIHVNDVDPDIKDMFSHLKNFQLHPSK
jgi:predicted ATP-dependent endonuclease of OLD family